MSVRVQLMEDGGDHTYLSRRGLSVIHLNRDGRLGKRLDHLLQRLGFNCAAKEGPGG